MQTRMYFERWGLLAPPLVSLPNVSGTLKVFLKDMFFCVWCLTVCACIEQMCKCTRTAFWRAGVQEAFVGLRQTQQRGTGEIALLGGEKTEPVF